MTLDKALAPPSPSASYYDLSDDEEGEYNTITHTSSGRGVKLLYSKSKVSQCSGLGTILFTASSYPEIDQQWLTMSPVGLHTPYPIRERQYTRIYRSITTKGTTSLKTNLLIFQELEISCFIISTPSMAPRTLSRRSTGYICQSGAL
jgi:hypothetical protein